MRILSETKIDEIEDKIAELDMTNADDLEKPIKKGTLCAAKFDVDNLWYRARVGQT